MQLAQVAHATCEFALRYPKEASSTPIGIVLEVPDRHALHTMVEEVEGTPYVLFMEEDLGGEATALATVCTGEHFSSLPLAGRAMAMT